MPRALFEEFIPLVSGAILCARANRPFLSAGFILRKKSSPFLFYSSPVHLSSLLLTQKCSETSSQKRLGN
jgi:hypothetical protein